MSDSYVTSKATLKCSFGDRTAKLTVYPDRTVELTAKPMANISDHISMYNIAPFGKCHTVCYPPTGSATAANHGCLTPMPCVPGTDTDWMNGKNDYIIKGNPALLKSSFCRCRWGGIITITDDGQIDTGSADLSRENAKTQEEMKAETEVKQNIDLESVLDGIQLALDIAGLVPGAGAIPDLLNASISALRGDWGDAGQSVLAALPFIGDAATGVKYAQKGLKYAQKNGLQLAEGETKMLKRGIPEDTINTLFRNKVEKDGNKYQKAFGSDVLKIKLTENKHFVRVYTDDNQKSTWIMEKSEIGGLSPNQIKEKFALKYSPTHVCDVFIGKNSILRKSIASKNDWGKGGGIQYTFKWNQVKDIYFSNGRTIDNL